MYDKIADKVYGSKYNTNKIFIYLFISLFIYNNYTFKYSRKFTYSVLWVQIYRQKRKKFLTVLYDV